MNRFLAEIFLSPKPSHHGQVKIVQIPDTHSTTTTVLLRTRRYNVYVKYSFTFYSLNKKGEDMLTERPLTSANRKKRSFNQKVISII